VDLDDVTRVSLDGQDRIRRIGKHIDDYNAFDTGVFLASPALITSIVDGVARGGGGSISEGCSPWPTGGWPLDSTSASGSGWTSMIRRPWPGPKRVFQTPSPPR